MDSLALVRRPRCSTVVLAGLLLTLVSGLLTTAEAQVTVGPNVNMGGGPAIFTPPSTIVGDPFLQRQNEPSIAVSSRNPCHLLAGANDYRLVDVEDAAGEVGDAWLGVFKSFDCGATWTSTLLPGHKLDTSAQGLASPIRGLAAAADPTVRAGTSGLFYYSGIAFNRGDNQPGKVFVARFIDNNNKDGGDPIQYLGAIEIDLGNSGQFLDKPWIVADIPRNGSTCTINGRTIPAGAAYLVYTSFVGGNNNVHSKIMFSKSTNCGATWSNPSKLSEGVKRNQGTAIAIDPGTGDIHVAWREFSNSGNVNENSIQVARSTDGGKKFTKADGITPNGYQFLPFDQASSPLTFRTNAYPSIVVVPAEAEGRAAGQPGRVYVAWAARGFGGARPSDARIVLSTAIGGVTWSPPRVTDSFQGAGHQIMPALAFAGGKLALAYYDLRDDASGGFDDLVFEYGQPPFDECMISPGANTPLGFAAVLDCIVHSASRLSRRHTLDMRAAMADAACLAAGTCDMTSTSVLGGSDRVSRYIEGRGTTNGPRVQLQFNRPNLPIFSKGKFPFIGDYIDIAGESFLANADGSWSWNTGTTANRPAPVFHVSWSDNRNVGTPRNTNWEQFTPPVLGPNSVACVPGQVGIRNQDVYTAQLRPDLVVSAPQNSKRITGLQRSFVVVTQNTSDVEHVYQLQAVPPTGVIASFDQFRGFGVGSPITSVSVTIPRKSSISRTVFVSLVNPPSDPNAAPDVLVPVQVTQTDGVPTDAAFDMVYLNPDFENPDFENPDFENAELHNPDFENPDFENPDFENPDFENFTLAASSSIRNPDFENPDYENPDFENPDFENPDYENPDFENPDYENPDFENPDFENPDFENPDFENPDFENGSFQVSDTTWPLRNNGNTTSAYKTNVFVNNPRPGVSYQLMVRKVFPSPAAVCTVPGTTAAPLSAQSVELVNIVHPDVQTSPFDRSFNDPSRNNATFSLAPGERGVITLRAYCNEATTGCTRDLVVSLQGTTALGVVAQGANCVRGDNGLGDNVGGTSTCEIVEGPPKDIYDPIPPSVEVLNPTISTPEIVVEKTDADNNGTEPVSFTIHATDNVAVATVSCVAGSTAVTLQSVSSDQYLFSGVFPVGTSGVTCTALDIRATPAPNAAKVNFSVVVKDVTPPSFDIPEGSDPGSPFVPSNPAEASGPNGAVVTYTNPSANDSNGGPVTVTCASSGGLVSGSMFPIGTTDINCVATDVSGVSTPPANLFDITVADRTPPVITVTGAPTANVEAGAAGGAIVTFDSSALDIVSGATASTCAPASGSVFTLGATTVTCSSTDGAGNTGSTTFVVTVADTTPPTMGAITNLVAEAAGPSGATVSYPNPTATDLVDASVDVACAAPSGSLFPLGSSSVTCTATDDSGNAASGTFTITVRDTTPPVVSGITNITAEASSVAGAVVAFTSPTATDAVGASVSCAPASGSTFALGTATVTCTATDSAGNHASVNFNVNVVDTTPPNLTVPANISVPATSPSGATVSYAAATATDVADAVVAVVCSKGSGSTFPISTTTVSCTATDDSSNATTKTFTVTVTNTAPTFTPPANITRSATSAAGAVVSFAATGSDVEDVTIGAVCTPASGSTFAITTTTVSCTVTDSGGLTATGSFTVTVTNNAPVASNGALTTNEDTTGAGTLSGSDVDGPSRTFSIVANGSKGTATITNPATGAFTYTPNANASGADSFTFKLNDGIVNSNTATVAVTVNAANDAPSFVKGANQTTIANSPTKTVTNWATAISRGPADESGQTVSFIVSNNNPALFATQPAVGSTGTLTYKAADSAKGVATVTVSAKDNGGTANGGQDTSAVQTFTITVDMTYGVINKQNLPPSSGTYFTRGTTVAMKWQFVTGGDGDYDADDVVNSANALPLITIAGPTGSAAKTYTFTPEAPGSGNSFGIPGSANGYTWQFNWLTKDGGTSLPAGYYTVSLTSRLTGQVFARGQIQLK